jgi:anti-sigma regulatory factor (Ser/Thr protein kinase)
VRRAVTAAAGTSSAPPPLRATDTARPEAVPLLRGAVARYLAGAGLTGKLVAVVKLAVSEAVTNAVVHAYVDCDEAGPVSVTTEVSQTEVLVTVADEGCGMRPRVDSPGAGLGLPLIMQVATTVQVTQSSGTLVTMSFARDA